MGARGHGRVLVTCNELCLPPFLARSLCVQTHPKASFRLSVPRALAPSRRPITHLVGAVDVLHSEKLGNRAPAADKLAEQDAVGVPLELTEVPAGGEGGYRGLSAGDYAAVPAGGLPSPSVGDFTTDLGRVTANDNLATTMQAHGEQEYAISGVYLVTRVPRVS